jgi:hypothetical protein
MLKSIRLGFGATLLAATQFAAAGAADVQLSNITLSVAGGEWWYYLPIDVDWVPLTAGASAALQSPAASDAMAGWHGRALGASAADGASFATATLGASAGGDISGVAASAHVVAENGQAGWAFAKVFDGQILVGGHATLTVSAIVDHISASGTTAQANAYIEFCSTDFVTDTCDVANYAEAFVDASSGPYSGSSVLTASWTNPGETVWAKMHIGLSASAETNLAPVPEPGTWVLMLAGLAGIGRLCSRREATGWRA